MIVRFTCPKCGLNTKTRNGMRLHSFYKHGASLKGRHLPAENNEVNPAKRDRNHMVKAP